MNDSYTYGKFSAEHLCKMKEGIEFFNKQFYWECHEALEDPWMEYANDPARYPIWAIIQVAASMVHVRDEKIIGAQGMLSKALAKIKYSEEKKVETDILFKYLDWKEFKRLVRNVPKDSQLEDFKELYDYRFPLGPNDWNV